MSRKIRAASVLVAVLALSLSMTFSPTALATSSWIASGNDGITKNQWVYFYTPRYVTSGGSNIYFRKSDGPGLFMKWYRCNVPSVNGPPGGVYWTDPDPQDFARLLDYGFAYNACFMLMVMSNGSNYTDEFSGTLWWNVFSNPDP
jgi:hypothetical protein